MVKHAFGNYRDILKEAAYSPLMAEHLTYLASKSHGYVYEDDDGRMTSPDENFARYVYYTVLCARALYLSTLIFISTVPSALELTPICL